METSEVQKRADKLKEDINRLLIDYCTETHLPLEALQAIREVNATSPKYIIDLGFRL